MTRREPRSERCAALELADQAERQHLATQHPRTHRRRRQLKPWALRLLGLTVLAWALALSLLALVRWVFS